VWHGALRSIPVAESLVRGGFTIRAQIIWVKERLVIGRGDYHWQHEPCWYALWAEATVQIEKYGAMIKYVQSALLREASFIGRMEDLAGSQLAPFALADR